MSEWKKLSLRQAGVKLIDCDHRTPPALDTGYPYVALPQVKNGRIDIDAARRISPEHFLEWTKKTDPSPYDVVLSRRCNPGETAFVAPGMRFALGQNLVLLRADGEAIYPPFLRWLVRTSEWWNEVGRFINVGAVFNSLRCADIPKFELPIPPQNEQRVIAHILGTLDDKIELNRRMNETLEAMARAIFQSWFVDFDPVRAKASGEPAESICQRLGLTPELLALFPDSFEDSELGEVPMGWEVSAFSETIQIIGGGTPKSSMQSYWDGDIPWFSVVDTPRESDVFVIDTEKKITKIGLENSSAKMLPEGSTIISARGTVGKVALVGAPMAMNQSCYGLRGLNGCDFSTYYATRELISALKRHSHGAVFDTITRDTFGSVNIISCEAVSNAFEAAVAPKMRKIKANNLHTSTLITLRDELLPKLLNGKLEVQKAEA